MASCGGSFADDGDVFNEDVTAAIDLRCRVDVTTDEGDGRGLSCAIGTEKSKDLTLWNTESYVVDSMVGAKLLLKVQGAEAVFALLGA